MPRLIFLALIVLISGNALAFELTVSRVTDTVYALVGETEARTQENHGLNNTLGFIITSNSVILVSSGTNAEAVKMIESAISSVSDKPIRHVINIGTQDHHWMGNHYFAQNGAQITALQRTVTSQKDNVDSQLTRLQQGIKEQIKTVIPMHANHVIDSDRHTFSIDGVELELIWPGKGHYAGDAVLWVPSQRVIFGGDFIYMERMLAIHPTSDAKAWQQSFHRIIDLQPEHIIPGHGKPTDIKGATRDTGSYLDWLTAEVHKAQEDWQDIEETIDKLSDAPQWRHLKHYDSWHRRNIHQTYLQMEASTD